ncbi:hypothetical protein [Streptomyces sp. NPDC020983]|uniref:hypothetical protein n=1 Tax=Streptomyces sp. NPDC020983 TaxID=3365106 RepID=UPI0037B9C18E
MATPALAVRAGAGMRLLRAALFAAVCVVLAAAGHTLASGTPVPVWSLALGWLGVVAVVAPLAGRERTLPGITASLAAGQLTLHMVFGAGQMCATPGFTPSSGGDGGLLTVAARLVCGTHATGLTPQAAQQIVTAAGLGPHAVHTAAGMPGMSPQAGLTAHSVLAALPLCSLPMLLAHLLAAVVAGWLLRRGEAALWRLVRLSVRGAAELTGFSPAAVRRAHALLAALAAGLSGAPRHGPPRTWETPRAAWRTVLLRHSVARRGPPQVVAA